MPEKIIVESGANSIIAFSGAVFGMGVSPLLIPDNWLVHVISGAIGAFLALSIVSPETIRESFFRLTTGMALAFVFTNPVVEYLDFFPQSDIHLTSGAVIGAVSWFFLGALKVPFLILKEEGLFSFITKIVKTVRGIKDDTY